MAMLFPRVGDCPGLQQFYSCGNGFRGCCSIDPCNPGVICPEDGDSSSDSDGDRTTSPPTTSRFTSGALTSTASTRAAETTVPSTTDEVTNETSPSSTLSSSTADTAATTAAAATTEDPTSKNTGDPTSSTTSTPATSTISSASLSPTFCPDANNTVFANQDNNSYQLICDLGLPGETLGTSEIATIDAFPACISSCDDTDECVGVTFLNHESGGTCNLKSAKGPFESCPDESSCTSAVRLGSSDSSDSASPLGAALGGALGGLAVLALLIALFFCLRRRKRARAVDEPDYRRKWDSTADADAEPMRVKDGQSVFAPFGGFYRGTKDVSSPTPSMTDTSATGLRSNPSTNKTDYRVVNQAIDDHEPEPAQLEDSRPISELADTSRSGVNSATSETRPDAGTGSGPGTNSVVGGVGATFLPYKPRTYSASNLGPANAASSTDSLTAAGTTGTGTGSRPSTLDIGGAKGSPRFYSADRAPVSPVTGRP